jgi:hypothetical protein
MKTKWNALRRSSLLPMIMAVVLAITIMGCEKEVPKAPGESLAPEAVYSGNIMDETFWVNPEGSSLVLFNGDISLEFPEGAVSVPTQFTLASFPLHQIDLDGHNYYNRGYSLSGTTTSDQQFMTNDIEIQIKYDLSEENWLKTVPVDPSTLTILNVSPTVYAYDKVVSIGDCYTDFSSKIIKGCICQCGFYVVGEN